MSKLKENISYLMNSSLQSVISEEKDKNMKISWLTWMDKSTHRVQTDKTNYRTASLFPRIFINISYIMQFSLQSFISEKRQN